MKNKKYLFFISLVFLCAFSIRFVQARDITSFNEGWSFKKGPFAKDPLLFSAGFDARWQDVTIPRVLFRSKRIIIMPVRHIIKNNIPRQQN